MTPRQLARQTRAALRGAANPLVAKSQGRFFKPWENISLYGLKTPEVRRIERELYQCTRKSWQYAEALAFCDLLMRDRYLEGIAAGLGVLKRHHRKFEIGLMTVARAWLEAGFCDNWAATDDLSTGVLTKLLDRFENLAPQFESWSGSPNLWVRRASAVVFVKPSRQGCHLDSAYRVVTRLLADDHDLIHKASGWLLREAGKTNRARLERFLLEHGPAIPRTTVRYAIERFPESRRLK